MDLLDRLPPEATARRADLQHTIDLRIDALVAATHQGRALREAAASYQGNWRDVVLFVYTVLFTVVWWNVKPPPHQLAGDFHRADPAVDPHGRLRGTRPGASRGQPHPGPAPRPA